MPRARRERSGSEQQVLDPDGRLARHGRELRRLVAQSDRDATGPVDGAVVAWQRERADVALGHVQRRGLALQADRCGAVNGHGNSSKCRYDAIIESKCRGAIAANRGVVVYEHPFPPKTNARFRGRL